MLQYLNFIWHLPDKMWCYWW